MSNALAMTDEDEELKEIIFESGLPGFPGETRFALVSWPEGPYSSLRSVENPELEFVVVPPVVFFPEYAPEIDDPTVGKLGLDGEDDALVLVIVSINAEDVSKSTANLLGPIVINSKSRHGVQAVLQGTEYQVRTPLVPA
jgi:flagellar assembly factor FliW